MDGYIIGIIGGLAFICCLEIMHLNKRIKRLETRIQQLEG